MDVNIRRQGSPRPLTTIARAERHGGVVCPDVLIVVHGRPGMVGSPYGSDLTAWFYGALTPAFPRELESVAAAARGGVPMPELVVALVLHPAGGGDLRLDDCAIGLPVRQAGPAS